MFQIHLRRLLAIVAAGAALACGGAADPKPGERTPLLVFAAASLQDLARDVAEEFERRQPAKIVFNFAGSIVVWWGLE